MKNKEYVPSAGDIYWYVGDGFRVMSTNYVDSYDDLVRFYQHNCFQTAELAAEAAESIKALLQEFTGKSKVSTGDQLNKLITEVFDRPDCPKWAKWAAVDINGKAHYYDERPYPLDTYFYNNRAYSWLVEGYFDASDWQNSLIKRPVEENKLPEWCKVGEWAYLKPFEYFEITNTTDHSISGVDCSGEEVYVDFHLGEVLQARLRPYTPEELEELGGLVGQVLKHSTGSYLVSAFETRWNQVKIESAWRDANELLTHWTHLDGRPCGKLEHLENGEWVD